MWRANWSSAPVTASNGPVRTVTLISSIPAASHVRRDLVVQTPRNTEGGRPTFSVRSPVRPNPIALAVVELRKVEGNTLYVVGVDCLDGTPLLDIKPYFATTDAIPDARAVSHARKG